ncbi:hypothetical protein ACHAXS_014389 [Conticribra weissflogii]
MGQNSDKIVLNLGKDVRISGMKFSSTDGVLFSASIPAPKASQRSKLSRKKSKVTLISDVLSFSCVLLSLSAVYLPVSVEGLWLWDILGNLENNFRSTAERTASPGDILEDVRGRSSDGEQCVRFADFFGIIGRTDDENDICDGRQDSMSFEGGRKEDILTTCVVPIESLLWPNRDEGGEYIPSSTDLVLNREVCMPMDLIVSLDDLTSPTRFHNNVNQDSVREYNALPSYLNHELRVPYEYQTIFDDFRELDSGGTSDPFVFNRDDSLNHTSHRTQKDAMDFSSIFQCKVTSGFTLVDFHEVMLDSDYDLSMSGQSETHSSFGTMIADETASPPWGNESSPSNVTTFAEPIHLQSSVLDAPPPAEVKCSTNCTVVFQVRIKLEGKSKHPDSVPPSASHHWFVSLHDITEGAESTYHGEFRVKLKCKRIDVSDGCDKRGSAANCKIKASVPYICRSRAGVSIPLQSFIRDKKSEFHDGPKFRSHYDRTIMFTLQAAVKSAVNDRGESLSDGDETNSIRKIVTQRPVIVAIPADLDDTGQLSRKQMKYTQLIYPLDLNGVNSLEVGDKFDSSKEYSFWDTLIAILQLIAGMLSPLAVLALARNSSMHNVDSYSIALEEEFHYPETSMSNRHNRNPALSNNVGPMGRVRVPSEGDEIDHQDDILISVENRDEDDIVETPVNDNDLVMQQVVIRPYDSIDQSSIVIESSPTPLRNNTSNQSLSSLREIEQESEQSDELIDDVSTKSDDNRSSSCAGRHLTTLHSQEHAAQAISPIIQTRVDDSGEMHQNSSPESPPQIERNNSSDLFSETAVPGHPVVLGELSLMTTREQTSDMANGFPTFNENASSGGISRENGLVDQQLSNDTPNPEALEGALRHSNRVEVSQPININTDSIAGSQRLIPISGINDDVLSPHLNHEPQRADEVLQQPENEDVSPHRKVHPGWNELKPNYRDVVNHITSNHQTEQLGDGDAKIGRSKVLSNFSSYLTNEISPVQKSQTEHEEVSRFEENKSEEDSEHQPKSRSFSGLGDYRNSLGVNQSPSPATHYDDASTAEKNLGGAPPDLDTKSAKTFHSVHPRTRERKQESPKANATISYTSNHCNLTESDQRHVATNSDYSNDEDKPAVDPLGHIRAEPSNAPDVSVPIMNRRTRQFVGICPSPTSTIAATTAEFAVQRKNFPLLERQCHVINERPSPVPCGDVKQGQRKRFAVSATDALKPPEEKYENSRRRNSLFRRCKNGSTEDVPTDHADQRSKHSDSNRSEVEPRRKSPSKNSSAEKKLLALSKVSDHSKVKVPSALIPLAEEMQRPVWQL